ncbi:MAG: hypothetical protein J0I20_27930 [Chloroflexi bacterium]|nr:hypothetical protein [Chloroflexota bacterium]OJV97523.1 MAG: hypothetical protein BGO39_07065 [Chloroflexi bacterium 54-19]
MIWAILLMGVVMGIGALVSIWCYKNMPYDRPVSPYQDGKYFKGFRDKFENPDSDSDKEYNGRD